MSLNLTLGLIATLSVAATSGAAVARPCLLAPDERPAASREAAPVVMKKGAIHRRAKAPDPCEPVAADARRLPRGRKPLPVMLGPQRDGH